MSQKINSKNLSYDTTLPPFLAAMRAQTGGGDGHQAPSIGRRQLGKKRSDSEEAEDAPLVLDEDGNVVSVDIEKDGTVRQKDEDGDNAEDGDEGPRKEAGGPDASTKSSAAIGGRKRKVGKVIGDTTDDTKVPDAAKADKKDKEDEPKEKKVKKKAKKIKLSFDEEDG